MRCISPTMWWGCPARQPHPMAPHSRTLKQRLRLLYIVWTMGSGFFIGGWVPFISSCLRLFFASKFVLKSYILLMLYTEVACDFTDLFFQNSEFEITQFPSLEGNELFDFCFNLKASALLFLLPLNMGAISLSLLKTEAKYLDDNRGY